MSLLDPFCGCGTAIAAAHQLGRRWIGIDITHLSIALQKYRLQDMFELVSGADYAVIGEPATVDGARELAHRFGQRGALSIRVVGAVAAAGETDGRVSRFAQGQEGRRPGH